MRRRCEFGIIIRLIKPAHRFLGEVAERFKAQSWKDCIRETVSRVRISPSPKKFMPPLWGLNFLESGSDTNCLVSRRDSKAGPLCEFECEPHRGARKANMGRRGRERRTSVRRLVTESPSF